MSRLKYIFFIYFLLLPSCVLSFDFMKSEGIGIGQTIQLSDPSASELLNIPSPACTDGSLKIDMGLNRSFNIKELNLGYLAFAYRKNNFSYTLGFSQLGQQDYYSERLGKLGFAYYKDALAVGIYLSYMKLSFGGHYDGISSTALSLGASYKRNRHLYGLLLEDINSPRFDENSEKINPKISAYGELIGKGSYSILARLTMQNNENTQLGIAQKIKLSSLASLFWGISSQPAVYGGGFEIYYKKSRISYAASYHPVLGLSYTISLAYNFGQKKSVGKQSEF